MIPEIQQGGADALAFTGMSAAKTERERPAEITASAVANNPNVFLMATPVAFSKNQPVSGPHGQSIADLKPNFLIGRQSGRPNSSREAKKAVI
jgi:hypothetical protein